MSDLNRILDKLDKIDVRQDQMSDALNRNSSSLEEHMRRTDILEIYVQKEIPPLKRLKQRAEGGAWVISIVLAGILAAKQLGLF